MKYLFILAFLVSGIAKAQTFDFGCAQEFDASGLYHYEKGDAVEGCGTNTTVTIFKIELNEMNELHLTEMTWYPNGYPNNINVPVPLGGNIDYKFVSLAVNGDGYNLEIQYDNGGDLCDIIYYVTKLD